MEPTPHPLDLDRLFHEGDDQTWEMEDWNWDPYAILAEPKGSPTRRNCQALKRHKTDHPQQQTAQTVSVMAAGCAAGATTGEGPQLQQQQGGCHAGMLSGQQQLLLQQQQQFAATAACGAPQHQPGMFQAMLGDGFNHAPWAQQLQQQQQAIMAQVQQQQGGQQLMPSLQPESAAAAAAGACCAHADAAAATACGHASHTHNGPTAARHCQALANGLPFLTNANMSLLQQQQQHLAMCNTLGASGHTTTASGAAAPAGLQHAMSTGQIDLAGLLQQQQQQQQQQHQAALLGLQRAQSQPVSAATAPGMDCSSAADSGSEDVPVPQQQQQQAVPPQLLLPGAAAQDMTSMAAAAAAAAVASPSTVTSAGQHVMQAAGMQATSTATENEAAAAAVAAGVPVLPGDDGDGGQKMVCQVPGCGRDLSGLKEYHQRYRICDVHIKLPQVMKEGRLQRFCQQCGRFHDLSAFDGNRKSCREQLQKHNARRRRRAALEQNMSLADSLLSAVDDKSEVGKLLQGLLSNPYQLQALRVLLGVQTHPALPQPSGQPAEHVPQLAAAGAVPANAANAATAANAQTYDMARDIMDGSGTFAPTFDSEHRVLRLSAKLFNVTPADLPPDVRSLLTGWLSSAPAAVEGYIRPGCVFLNLHMTVDKREYEEAKLSGMQRLLTALLSSTAHAFWHTHVYMLQLFDTVAVISRGQLMCLDAMSGQALAAHKLPRDVVVTPLAVVAGQPVALQLAGQHISSADCSIIVKGGGKLLHLGGVGRSTSCKGATAVLTAEVGASAVVRGSAGTCCGGCSTKVAQEQQTDAAVSTAAGSCGRELLSCVVEVPAGRPVQLLWVEVARGAFLSQARPVLVVDDPQLAQEISALQSLEGTLLSSSQVDALLCDLGLVLGHISTSSSGNTTAPGCGIPHAVIAEKARRLIGFASDQGWVAVAAAVLPLASACGACAHDIVAAIHDSTAQDGLSLLHRAVRSGSPALVRGILDWGAAHAYSWSISSGGPSGITPLHLAALLDDDGVVALMLLDACEGVSAFTDACADDGVSPFHLAFQMGHYSVDRVLAGLGVGAAVTSVLEQQLQPTGWQLLKMAAEATDASSSNSNSNAAPLKERVTSCLDACLYCQSTLPPLLLSIKAKCAGCGERQPCVKGGGEEPGSPLAAALQRQQQQQQQQQEQQARAGRHGVAAAAAVVAAPVAAPAVVAAGGDGCAHVNGRVLSVTALCQTCHANRVLEVA